jgi:hypothetical protein
LNGPTPIPPLRDDRGCHLYSETAARLRPRLDRRASSRHPSGDVREHLDRAISIANDSSSSVAGLSKIHCPDLWIGADDCRSFVCDQLPLVHHVRSVTEKTIPTPLNSHFSYQQRATPFSMGVSVRRRPPPTKRDCRRAEVPRSAIRRVDRSQSCRRGRKSQAGRRN